jgi:hypothetical protein
MTNAYHPTPDRDTPDRRSHNRTSDPEAQLHGIRLRYLDLRNQMNTPAVADLGRWLGELETLTDSDAFPDSETVRARLANYKDRHRQHIADYVNQLRAGDGGDS